jgi:hypothetical protein
MISHLYNRCVREFLILTRTWFAFGLSSKTGCDRGSIRFVFSGDASADSLQMVNLWDSTRHLRHGGYTGSGSYPTPV